MWMWILISLAVAAILAVGAAIVFVNAVGGAYDIFSATGSRGSLFRWPENLWPRKHTFRFPLPAACIDEADRGKPPPDLNLAEIEKAVDAFSARAEAIYAAHKGSKPTSGGRPARQGRAPTRGAPTVTHAAITSFSSVT